MKRFFLLISLLLFVPAASYAGDADKSSDTKQTSTTGREMNGKPVGTDVQGNPDDKNAQGSRPKDAQGNTPKDFYGNKVGTENK